jgi:hypothetical protein
MPAERTTGLENRAKPPDEKTAPEIEMKCAWLLLEESALCTPASEGVRNKGKRTSRQPLVNYSVKNASDCNWVISNGLRQRIFAQDNLSSRLTM